MCPHVEQGKLFPHPLIAGHSWDLLNVQGQVCGQNRLFDDLQCGLILLDGEAAEDLVPLHKRRKPPSALHRSTPQDSVENAVTDKPRAWVLESYTWTTCCLRVNAWCYADPPLPGPGLLGNSSLLLVPHLLCLSANCPYSRPPSSLNTNYLAMGSLLTIFPNASEVWKLKATLMKNGMVKLQNNWWLTNFFSMAFVINPVTLGTHLCNFNNIKSTAYSWWEERTVWNQEGLFKRGWSPGKHSIIVTT